VNRRKKPAVSVGKGKGKSFQRETIGPGVGRFVFDKGKEEGEGESQQPLAIDPSFYRGRHKGTRPESAPKKQSDPTKD